MTVTELNKIIGKNIKYFRVKKGKTQLDLASELGVTRATVHYWEIGKCFLTLLNLILVADYLNIEIYQIFKVTEETQSIKNKRVKKKCLRECRR